MSGAEMVSLELVRTAIGGGLVGIGLAFVLAGALGQMRFPDYYTRVHGAALTDAAGAFFVLLGLAVATWDAALAVRFAILFAIISACGPASVQAVTSAAHAGGLDPLVGRYRAPRPGLPEPDGGP